jgi:hypothetical protein
MFDRANSPLACTPRSAAKHELAAFSVAPVASGYERFLRPCEHGFSRDREAQSADEVTRV